jgi:hypothetical protein
MSINALEKVAEALGTTADVLIKKDHISLQQLSELSHTNIPQEIVEFFAKQDSLPYAVLAKDLSDEGISPESFKLILDNIKLMMKSIQ